MTTPFELDQDGYLLHVEHWNPEIAENLAKTEQIELTPLHWETIHFVRQYYLEHQDIPKMRDLISHLRTQREKISSADIHQLFPLSPALQIAKIAGLPKPKRCL